MAALKAGVKTVIIPKDNYSDVNEFPRELREGLEFVPVTDVGEVLSIAVNPGDDA